MKTSIQINKDTLSTNPHTLKQRVIRLHSDTHAEKHNERSRNSRNKQKAKKILSKKAWTTQAQTRGIGPAVEKLLSEGVSVEEIAESLSARLDQVIGIRDAILRRKSFQ